MLAWEEIKNRILDLMDKIYKLEDGKLVEQEGRISFKNIKQ